MSPTHLPRVSEKKIIIDKFVPAENVLQFGYQVLEGAQYSDIAFSLELLSPDLNVLLTPTISIQGGEYAIAIKVLAEEDAGAFVILRARNVGLTTFLAIYKKNFESDQLGVADIYRVYHVCEDVIFSEMRAYVERWEAPVAPA